MRERWIACEHWLRERLGSTVRQIVRWWGRQTTSMLKQVRHVTPRRSAPAVATMVGDVLQVDPLQAAHWHRAWLTYLDAKILDVELRQATHRVLATEEDAG